MKKWLAIFLAIGSLTFANEKEERAQELCSFTQDVFSILREEGRMIDHEKLGNTYASFVKRLHQYENDSNSEIATLAKKFIASFQEGAEAKEEIGDAVSSLGCLLKCSVDNENYRSDTSSFLLRKQDIQKELSLMEVSLKEVLPKEKGTNYHKLMMESLADQKYDLALYAYLKIAENRCQEVAEIKK